mmetsp:Transcript_23984/g.36815  ORF Transcript_23984/g.36815 Transcript_23984/m.36815 type:complete len:101 (-) Transcript_23984:731-1033(-)
MSARLDKEISAARKIKRNFYFNKIFMTTNIIQFALSIFDENLIRHMMGSDNLGEWQQKSLTQQLEGKDLSPEEENHLRVNQEFKALAFKFGSIIYPKQTI